MQSHGRRNFVRARYETNVQTVLNEKSLSINLIIIALLFLYVIYKSSTRYTYCIDSDITASVISFVRYDSCLLTVRICGCIFFGRIHPDDRTILERVRYVIRSPCAVRQRCIWNSIVLGLLSYTCKTNELLIHIKISFEMYLTLKFYGVLQ